MEEIQIGKKLNRDSIKNIDSEKKIYIQSKNSEKQYSEKNIYKDNRRKQRDGGRKIQRQWKKRKLKIVYSGKSANSGGKNRGSGKKN